MVAIPVLLVATVNAGKPMRILLESKLVIQKVVKPIAFVRHLAKLQQGDILSIQLVHYEQAILAPLRIAIFVKGFKTPHVTTFKQFETYVSHLSLEKVDTN